MKATYDPQADALAIRWSDASYGESDEVEPGIILDYDKDGNIIGVEVLNASKQIKQIEGKPLLITTLNQLPQWQP